MSHMSHDLPKVSILTPTYKRETFLPSLIKIVENQDYPGEKEWIILDDGDNDNSSLFAAIPYARYYHMIKTSLDIKRNQLNKMATGQILINFDDDDYYRPERVSYSVAALLQGSAQLAGCSSINVYFLKDKKIYRFGPMGAKHATAATMAYTQEYAQSHSYSGDFGEERNFTNNWTESIIQLETDKIIMALSHSDNTVDKNLMISEEYGSIGCSTHETTLTLSDLILESDLARFYQNLQYQEHEGHHSSQVRKNLELQLENVRKAAKERISNLVKAQKIRYDVLKKRGTPK
jgi:glycosyltransferase involved in cell wall biosynthesis